MAKLTVPEVKFWLAEADSCEERQKKVLLKKNAYPFIRKYYEGTLRRKENDLSVVSRELFAVINEHFPNTNALISDILFKHPDFILEATKPFVTSPIVNQQTGQPNVIDVEAQAPFMKSGIQYANEKTQSLIEYRIATFDMLYAGYCCIDINHAKVDSGMDINLPNEQELQKREGGSVGRFVKNFVNRAKDTKEAEENLEKAIPPVEERKATPDKTYIIRQDPMDVLFDWRAKRLKDRRYDLFKIRMSKAEFDAKYPKFKDRVPAGRAIPFSMHKFEEHSKSVLLYEFQIRAKNDEYWTLIVSPTVGDSEIDFFKRPYTTNGFNRKIGTLHKYGEIYPIAMAMINKTLADEMNEYVMHLKDVAERSVPKLVADANKVDAGAEEAVQSKKVRDIAYVKGNPQNAFHPLVETPAARENTQLIQLFERQKQKQWSTSSTKIGGPSEAEFATELQIQEAGFQQIQTDAQEGLRLLYNEVNETLKDIIASLWDDEVFFKVTGGAKPQWYKPEVRDGRVINPLTEMLTADYHVKTDISTSLRPNKQREVQEKLLFLRELNNLVQLLAMQGKMVNVEEISRMSKQFGFNPETLLIDITPEAMQKLQAQAGGK